MPFGVVISKSYESISRLVGIYDSESVAQQHGQALVNYNTEVCICWSNDDEDNIRATYQILYSINK